MKKILFLCTGNSCRSQMAEGFAKNILPKDWAVFSAGTRADRLNKNAVQVMKEVWIDISSQYSKTIDDLKDIKPDIVITLCDNAKQSCSVYSSTTLTPPSPIKGEGDKVTPRLAAGNYQVEHWGLPDPADATGSEDEILKIYRSVRDDIQKRLNEFLMKIQNA